MAFSLLVACSRSAQLALGSMKRTSAALLRPLFALSLPFALALLLPRLLSFLASLVPLLSSLLHPAPIFILANILILAIVLSSPSSQSNSQENSFSARFPPHAYAPDTSSHNPRPELTGPTQQRRRAPESASSDFSKCLVPVYAEFDRRCDVVCSSPHRTFSKSKTHLSQKFCPAFQNDSTMKQLVIKERPSKDLQLKKPLSVKEPAEERRVVSGEIARSNSDSRIRTGGHAAACEKVMRRTVTMDNASVVLRAGCHGKSSSMIVMDVAPIENLMDEDFHKRCAEFIANNYQNWKNESQTCRR